MNTSASFFYINEKLDKNFVRSCYDDKKRRTEKPRRIGACNY